MYVKVTDVALVFEIVTPPLIMLTEYVKAVLLSGVDANVKVPVVAFDTKNGALYITLVAFRTATVTIPVVVRVATFDVTPFPNAAVVPWNV